MNTPSQRLAPGDVELTILRAAENLLREAGINLVREATLLEERECANAALLASVNIADYLRRADALDRPF